MTNYQRDGCQYVTDEATGRKCGRISQADICTSCERPVCQYHSTYVQLRALGGLPIRKTICAPCHDTAIANGGDPWTDLYRAAIRDMMGQLVKRTQG